MNGIINVACNQLFPYFNALSVLNILISVFVFFMMILSYFLTVRFQFYEFLEGNFENYGVETYKTEQLPGYNMDSTRNNDVELMPNGVPPYWLSIQIPILIYDNNHASIQPIFIKFINNIFENCARQSITNIWTGNHPTIKSTKPANYTIKSDIVNFKISSRIFAIIIPWSSNTLTLN